MNEVKSKQKKKGNYYVVFKIDDVVLGYIEDEIHQDSKSAEKAKLERIRVTGIEGELGGYYDVIYHEGNIKEILPE